MLLCSVAEVSAAALQEMNPLVKVTVHAGSADIEDLSFVASYQVINCASAVSLYAGADLKWATPMSFAKTYQRYT